jgi:L-lactate permease
VLPYAFIIVAYAVVCCTDRMKSGRSVLCCYVLLTAIVAAPLLILSTGRGERYPALIPIIASFRPADAR